MWVTISHVMMSEVAELSDLLVVEWNMRQPVFVSPCVHQGSDPSPVILS